MKNFIIVSLIIAAGCSFCVTDIFASSNSSYLYDTEDAPTYIGGPNTNWNNYDGGDADVELWSGKFWNGLNTRSYLKFDLSSQSNAITSAVLSLYNIVDNGVIQPLRNRGGSTYESAVVDIYAVSDNNWNEDTVTWNNQPALGSKIASTTVDFANGWYYWDLTSVVESQKGGILSLALVSNDMGHVFYGDETQTGFAPRLNITAAPEPASFLLFGLGGLALRLARRRKTRHN